MFLLKEERSDHSNAFLLKEELSDPLYPPLFPSSLYIKIGKNSSDSDLASWLRGQHVRQTEEQIQPLGRWVRFPRAPTYLKSRSNSNSNSKLKNQKSNLKKRNDFFSCENNVYCRQDVLLSLCYCRTTLRTEHGTVRLVTAAQFATRLTCATQTSEVISLNLFIAYQFMSAFLCNPLTKFCKHCHSLKDASGPSTIWWFWWSVTILSCDVISLRREGGSAK